MDTEEVFRKVVLMGKSKVGKTRLIKSFRTTFPDDNQTVCHVYNRKYSYYNFSIRMQIWDTSDIVSLQEKIPFLLCKANIIVLVFDTGKPESLAYLMKYIKEIKKCEESYKVIILGHHLTQPRCVQYSGGKMFADASDAEYIECEDDLRSDFFCSYLAKTIADQCCIIDNELSNRGSKSRMDCFKSMYKKLD